MRKKALLALALAMTLLLSSCALIVKDEAVDNATVIIKMGDTKITKAEVKKEMSEQMFQMEQYYAMFGQPFDSSDPEIIQMIRESAVESIKERLAKEAKVKELGLELTAEEEEEAKATAQETYNSYLESVKSGELADSGLEGEELDKAAAEKLAEYGQAYTLEGLIEEQRTTALNKKLREYVTKDIVVADDEIQAEYDTRVENDKATYGENPGSYASAVNNGTTVYYAPAGVRRVKQILTKFKDEDQAAINEAQTALDDANAAVSAANAKIESAQSTIDTEGVEESVKEEAEANLKAANEELENANKAVEDATKALEEATAKAYENIDPDADGILASLGEGADWQTLMDEKNQDPGMKDNEKGYAVAAGMTNFDPAFVEAAMALEKPGDYSEKIKGSYGYYIIRYESDEPEGPIALDNVKESISNTLLSNKQSETYNAALEQWVADAGFKVDMNSLKD